MLYIIIGIVAALLVLLLIVAAMQSADFRISRSATIAAPPDIVFAQVNELLRWEAWSPWAKIDPSMKTTYEGPAAGVGAKYSWVGKGKVGEGRMTITDSTESKLVRIRLEFLKPFAATNITEFTFRPEGKNTHVEWSMTGQRNFIMKAMCLFMNMDKMVGRDFEKGLAAMKQIAEAEAKDSAAAQQLSPV